MPGFDRTGPEGEGPRTGRAMGKCNPKGEENTDLFEGRGRGFGRGRRAGRGLGRGRGRGRGFGNGQGKFSSSDEQ